MGRGMFQATMSVVRSQGMSDAWKKVRYLVFDAPSHPGAFEDRLDAVKQLVKGAPYAKAIRHYRCKGEGHMVNELEVIESRGGEGLMLRAPESEYEGRRSRTLLKVKTFHDSEARIVSYYPGKGKHKGVIGGFHVETLGDPALGIRKGVKFKLGTGLTDAERKHPPRVGSVITFRYQELSDSGTPRFASFVRVRKSPARASRRNPFPFPQEGGGLDSSHCVTYVGWDGKKNLPEKILYCGSHDQCFTWLHKHQGQSVDWAIKHGGYSIQPAPWR
jgi:DNA ligase-1